MVLSQKRINISQEDQSNSGMSLLIRAYHNSIIPLNSFGPILHDKMKPAKLFAQYDVIAWCLCTTMHTLCPIYRSVWYPSYNQQSCLVVVWCLCTTIHTLCPIYNLVWYTTIQPVLLCMGVYHTNMIALGAIVHFPAPRCSAEQTSGRSYSHYTLPTFRTDVSTTFLLGIPESI